MKKSNEEEKLKLSKEIFLTNWNIPLFINFDFSELVNFIKIQFISHNDEDLLLLYRLYKEICIMEKDDNQKGLNLIISEGILEKLSNEQIYYLLENIKKLLYLMLDEIKSKNNINDNKYIYNTISNDNTLLEFIKINFYLFINLFKNGNPDEKQKITTEEDLDSKFLSLFGVNNNLNENDKMDIDNNDIDYNNKIKIEVLNIYNVIISTYSDNEKPYEEIIYFSEYLVKFFVSNNQNKNDLMVKTKKSLTLLIGLYIEIFNAKKLINHPIRIIVQNIFNFIVKNLILFSVKNKTSDNNILNNYYQYLVSIYKILLKQNKNDIYLVDIQNSILYFSKQLIYENVDSTEYRSPSELKNIHGLNDIGGDILFHPYLIKILFYLDEKYAKAFLGFYIRFFEISGKNELFCCVDNITICVEYFIKIGWLPEEHKELIGIIKNKNTEFEKNKKIIEYVFHYLTTYKLAPESNEKEKESKKKACEKLKHLYKNIILENINVI